MPKDIKKIRDELANKYHDDQMRVGEFNLRHMDDQCSSFKTGFDAGFSLALKEAQVLIDALNSYKAAMDYAYEDHADRYYLNVKEQAEKVLIIWQERFGK